MFNNTGYSLVGTIEEASTDDILALYETNVIGSVSVIQAALPLLRKQGAVTSWVHRATWVISPYR